MSEVFVDAGELYERAKGAARAAVAGSPDTTSGLKDVMPEDDWLTVTASKYVPLLPLNGTLDGCIEALRERKVSAAQVKKVDGSPPRWSACTAEDMRVARSWIVHTLTANLDEEGRQKMMQNEATARGWVSDPVRLTSLVLALVSIASVAVSR